MDLELAFGELGVVALEDQASSANTSFSTIETTDQLISLAYKYHKLSYKLKELLIVLNGISAMSKEYSPSSRTLASIAETKAYFDKILGKQFISDKNLPIDIDDINDKEFESFRCYSDQIKPCVIKTIDFLPNTINDYIVNKKQDILATLEDIDRNISYLLNYISGKKAEMNSYGVL